MNSDKQLEPKKSAPARWPPDAGPEVAWSDIDDDDTMWLSEQQHHIRVIVKRAVMAYLLLFLGLGLMMSALGVDPLVNNGLMPKALLLFVGLALLLALANNVVDISRRHGLSWLVRGLAHRRPPSATSASPEINSASEKHQS